MRERNMKKHYAGKGKAVVSILLSGIGVAIFTAMLMAVLNSEPTEEAEQTNSHESVVVLGTTEELTDDILEKEAATDVATLEKTETLADASTEVVSETSTPDSTTMEVHFIDVGQSDSTLVINGDHAMLIDAGDNDKGTAIQMYLQKQGIECLDYLVLTHTDADHIGGADVIITKFDIDTVFMGNFEKDNATYRDVIQALDNKNLQWSTPEVGNQYTLGDASFTIIAPNDTYEDVNNTSIGLLLEKGETTFLFTGDAEEKAEADIVKNSVETGLDINADVYQVGHHGSSTSSSQALLDAVAPECAVISCSENNSYGFPHAETLNSLRERGVKVFRTDEQGSIVATSDGVNITWNCAPSETWQTGTKTESSASSQTNNQSQQAVVVTATPTPEITPSQEQQTAAEITYICNTNTKKFHYPSCSSVDQMKDKNKLETTAGRDEVIAQGYEPCKRCNP